MLYNSLSKTLDFATTTTINSCKKNVLPGSRENQNGFRVFVLDTSQVVVFLGSIQLLLAGRMRIQVLPDACNSRQKVLWVSFGVCCFQLFAMLICEHIQRREDKLVERILPHVRSLPVNEFINIVRRGLKRKDHACQFNIVQVRFQLRMVFCNLVERLKGDSLVSLSLNNIRGHVHNLRLNRSGLVVGLGRGSFASILDDTLFVWQVRAEGQAGNEGRDDLHCSFLKLKSGKV
mmetsp:Transcript_8794/g.24350  ORF Transcript_8794/g.24350 Transcript_8794/m.24350 type:complete len:233 (+) Transcript_8794:154-852(+)